MRFVVFGKFCFEETKRSHTKTKNEKKLIKSLKKSFFDMEILRNVFFVFVFQTKTKRNKVFFQRGNKKRTVRSQKKRNVDIPTLEYLQCCGDANFLSGSSSEVLEPSPAPVKKSGFRQFWL